MCETTILATIEQLIHAVNQETPDWDFVNANIAVIANSDEARKWSFGEGYQADNGDLRDLAMSMVEAGDYELSDEEKVIVRGRLDDENPYAGFRAALALYKRGDRSEEVMTKMTAALDDPDVKETAKIYLDQENKNNN